MCSVLSFNELKVWFLALQNINSYALGKPCGDNFCDYNMECCMGCDGPMGICQLPRDQGGIGCPIHRCKPQGKIDISTL